MEQHGTLLDLSAAGARAPAKSAPRDKLGTPPGGRPVKRRCVSNACIACRRRKSKCDGNTPACAACASVYHTQCVYDPNSDHRRKGVYKKDIDTLKTQNCTLQTLVEALLNGSEEQAFELVRMMRACESLDELEDVVARLQGRPAGAGEGEQGRAEGESPDSAASIWEGGEEAPATLEAELSGKMGALRLEDGQVRFIGATSNLIFFPAVKDRPRDQALGSDYAHRQTQSTQMIASWTTVTDDVELIMHLMHLYFTYHYPFFTTLSRQLFWREFVVGKPEVGRGGEYCTSLLVNVMLALGCHFTTDPRARSDPNDTATAGNHFFKEAKRLIYENDEHETPSLATVQALALMSVREAGCGRESKGWLYSGMSFRMAMDLGLHLDPGTLQGSEPLPEEVDDARRITFWGCFLFDKCWSNYLGRMPQLPSSIVTVPKPIVLPTEDSQDWVPYTDSGPNVASRQPSRIRAIARQISNLCEISNDILLIFYNPTPSAGGKASAPPSSIALAPRPHKPPSLQTQFKKLGELFTRLEDWRKSLPAELDAKEGSLPSALLMHMFHQTLYIHLFRPFLKFSTGATPLSHLDPRKACLGAATAISKYLRFYKRRYGLAQICNVAGYFLHSAVTIHLLNHRSKSAARDIHQGLKALEEMGVCWLVARRALVIVDITVHRWQIALAPEAAGILERARPDAVRFGLVHPARGPAPSPPLSSPSSASTVPVSPAMHPPEMVRPFSYDVPPTAGQFAGFAAQPADGPVRADPPHVHMPQDVYAPPDPGQEENSQSWYQLGMSAGMSGMMGWGEGAGAQETWGGAVGVQGQGGWQWQGYGKG